MQEDVSRAQFLVSRIWYSLLSGMALSGRSEEVTQGFLDIVMPFREIVADATEEVVTELVAEATATWAGPGIVAGGEQ